MTIVDEEIVHGDYLKAKADVLRQLRSRFADAGKTKARKHAEDLLERRKRIFGCELVGKTMVK